MKYAILLLVSVIFCLTSNIAGRFLKKSQIKNNVYVTNKFLLCLYATKRKILLSAYVNYIAQLILTITLFILCAIDWITKTTILINSIWIYIGYGVISLIFISVSGICNKWNY